jgi:hypothetical protein
VEKSKKGRVKMKAGSYRKPLGTLGVCSGRFFRSSESGHGGETSRVERHSFRCTSAVRSEGGKRNMLRVGSEREGAAENWISVPARASES